MAAKYFIKICGITSKEDARLCVDAGATAIGFNFYPQSQRYIDPVQAKEIAESVKGKIQTVGVFVNETTERVKEIASLVKLQYCQFHGDENPETVNLFGNAIKAFRVNETIRNVQFEDYTTTIFLFDGYDEKEYGGTGKTFNWLFAREANEFGKIIIAGGLNETNVAEAISVAQPWGVDVSGGVELAPGKKDPAKVKKFIDIARKGLA